MPRFSTVHSVAARVGASALVLAALSVLPVAPLMAQPASPLHARLQDAGQSVPATQLRSGDLVIFRQRGEATHAGIYVGADRFVHAPSTGGEVRLDNLRSKYWAAQQVAYRRP